jgi:hypothetical protein
VIVRADLSPGYQLVQSNHALVDFLIRFPHEASEWHKSSNYIAALQTRDENHLMRVAADLMKKRVKHVVVREPDIGDQITAIAVEPGEITRKVCSRLPLALKGVGEGKNKHSG